MLQLPLYRCIPTEENPCVRFRPIPCAFMVMGNNPRHDGTNDVHVFQATTEDLCDRWITCINRQSKKAYEARLGEHADVQQINERLTEIQSQQEELKLKKAKLQESGSVEELENLTKKEQELSAKYKLDLARVQSRLILRESTGNDNAGDAPLFDNGTNVKLKSDGADGFTFVVMNSRHDVNLGVWKYNLMAPKGTGGKAMRKDVEEVMLESVEEPDPESPPAAHAVRQQGFFGSLMQQMKETVSVFADDEEEE